ncbi:hypothetical protein EJ05DRAFT_227067 [Pseudovirgaria hyperparasitica]|uniref:Uncharacterized protein n=1 Tax=Pseudovirgaria hyperparasitica TaxID=470096 RepID=A0A6A6VSM3_9PEZI|nr:uncharacterized protein EJ05DRAFT_227067 [Pseudovirgaria hyperparasitica]KAF2753155.1 hypothetical protein EJ05DRAFT_227067 [Pseudovirgaria hyperparasitica]
MKPKYLVWEAPTSTNNTSGSDTTQQTALADTIRTIAYQGLGGWGKRCRSPVLSRCGRRRSCSTFQTLISASRFSIKGINPSSSKEVTLSRRWRPYRRAGIPRAYYISEVSSRLVVGCHSQGRDLFMACMNRYLGLCTLRLAANAGRYCAICRIRLPKKDMPDVIEHEYRPCTSHCGWI